jgi:hypothetical protein
MLRMMEELKDKEASAKEPTGPLPEAKNPDLCIVPAHDEADHIAGMALARLLVKEKFQPELLHASLAGEVVDQVVEKCEHSVCISAVPPNAVAPASYLCKRLRQRFPEMKIVVALWGADGHLERTKQRLTEAGANEIATTLAEAVHQIRGLGLPRAAQPT